jgi:hypothetical protein
VAPPDHEFGNRSARMRGFTLERGKRRTKRGVRRERAVVGAHHVLWTGCKSNETSADAYFSGRYNGAFTYNFVKVMRDTKNRLSRKNVIAKMRTLMKGHFAQNPQLEGNATNRGQAIAY